MGKINLRLCNDKVLADHPVGDLVIKKSKAVPDLENQDFCLW